MKSDVKGNGDFVPGPPGLGTSPERGGDGGRNEGRGEIAWPERRSESREDRLLPEDQVKPVHLTREARKDLPTVTEETRDALKDLGVSDETIDAMCNDAEAQIYLDAGLEPTQVNGKEVLVRTDIDPDQVDLDGDSNLERMRKGKAPLDKDGRPIELHHIGQKQDSALAELTRAEHREGGNDCVLHDKYKETEIDRVDFDKERQAHWKARAEQIIQSRQGEDA
jgi:hypothetical protein